MSSYSATYYHLVWSTKNRQPFITEPFEVHLYRYIFGIIRNKNIQLLRIGGMPDHVHLLIKKSPDQSLPDLVREIKINSTKMLR